MTRALAAELAALNALGRALGVCRSPGEAADAALQAVFATAGPDHAFLFLHVDERLVLQAARSATGMAALCLEAPHRLGECLCGISALEGRPLYTRDLPADPRCSLAECKRAGIGSLAALPLRCGPEIIGVLCLATEAERDFEAQADFLETLAQQVAVVVHNAQLLGLAQRELEERRRAEDRLRLALQAARQGIFDLNVQSGEAQVSDEYAAMLGYDPKEFRETNKAWIEQLHPDDREGVAAVFRDYVAGAIPEYRVEFRQRTRAGEWIWILSLGRIVERDAAGRPLRMLGTHTDITERKRVEEELRANGEQLRALSENLADGMVYQISSGRDGLVRKFTYVSPAVERMHGLTVEDLLEDARRLYGQMLDLDRGRVAELEAIALATRTKMDVDVRVQVPGLGLRWRRFTSSPRPCADGSIVWDGIETDITERMQAQESLRDSERRYRTLFDSNPHPMWVYDVERLVFLAVNDAAIAHYGYSREEFLAMTIADIRPPDEVPRLLESVARAGRAPVDRAGIWRHRTKDGRLIDVEITTHILDFEGRRAELVLAHDITERRRAAAERERLQAQLTHAQKMESVGRLAGGVAHDFNNMLQAILGNAALALEALPPESRVREHLEEIQRSAERSADLTRQLLAFARKQEVQLKVMDLNDAVAGALKMLRRLVGEDLELSWMPGPRLWPVKADPGQVDQMLTNLCVNARDAVRGGGKVTIETRNVVLDDAFAAAHPGCQPGEHVLLAVSDNGVGMDEETLSHLFEPFFTTKGVGKGTGLGLATVFGIVQQSRGVIDVDSGPGRGTAFRIYLPRTREAVATPGPAAAPAAAGGRETVLVAEDEAQVLNLSRHILQRHGYRVLAANSPEAALVAAEEHQGPIHLLLTDVVMPGMNGQQLWQRLRERHAETRCLFMSGYTADLLAHHGVPAEGVNFLAKPFTLPTLVAKVREVLS